MASDTMASAQSGSGLTDKEAKEFHEEYFMKSMGYFAILASFAHIMVWAWRPWIPGGPGWDAAEAVITNTPLNVLVG